MFTFWKKSQFCKNSIHPHPLIKADFKAKVNTSFCPDRKFRLTIVVLEHNHGLTPDKAPYHKMKQENGFLSETKIGSE